MPARGGRIQQLQHKESKDSNIKWFIISIIPLVNLYFIWKLAESLAGHEKTVQRYEKLNHQAPKGSTLKWFIGFLVAGSTWAVGFLSVFFALMGGFMAGPGGALLGAGAGAALFIVGLIIYLYLFWKTSELIAGHDEIYERYARLDHGERKGSTAKWFALGFFGLLLSAVIIGVIMILYYYWKVAWVISGHDVEYTLRESGSSGAEGKRRAGVRESKKCPNCGASIPKEADFCPECGAEIKTRGEKIKCPECGAEVDGKANFCPICGAELEERGNECPNCGAEVEEGANFCPECGTKMGGDNT